LCPGGKTPYRLRGRDFDEVRWEADRKETELSLGDFFSAEIFPWNMDVSGNCGNP